MSSNPAIPREAISLSEPVQREITRLCVETGLLLMQHGAESALVENLTRRLGLVLGVRSVEVAIMANAITVTTLSENHCITTVRRNEDRGINMHVVTEAQRAVLAVEAGELDRAGFRAKIEAIKPQRYPRWLVALMIGFSCACFARLAGADGPGCALTFVASAVAMVARQVVAARHFNPLVTFFVTAFVATSIAGQGLLHQIGLNVVSPGAGHAVDGPHHQPSATARSQLRQHGEHTLSQRRVLWQVHPALNILRSDESEWRNLAAIGRAPKGCALHSNAGVRIQRHGDAIQWRRVDKTGKPLQVSIGTGHRQGCARRVAKIVLWIDDEQLTHVQLLKWIVA